MRRMLEFTLDGATDGRHRMSTPGGSRLEFQDNGRPPPGRLVVMYGARSTRAVPVEVLDDRPDGLVVRLPGSGAVMTISSVDRCEGPPTLLMVPIEPLPWERRGPVAVRPGRSDEELAAMARHPTAVRVA